MFIIRIDRRWRKAARRLRICDKVKIRFFVPWTPLVFTLRQVENQPYSFVRFNISKERVIKLAHRIERLHEHVGVRYFPG